MSRATKLSPTARLMPGPRATAISTEAIGAPIRMRWSGGPRSHPGVHHPLAAVCSRAAPALVGVAVAAGLSACSGGDPSTSAPPPDRAGLAAATANAITVSPLPDTPDASPSSQISFLGGAGTRVRDVRVRGSRSGPHPGRLQTYSTGTGESFVPSTPFLPGEHVAVHAELDGATRRRALATSFTVAAQAAIPQGPFPAIAGDVRAVQHYRSAPALVPSTVTVTTPARPGAAPGDFFLAPYQGEGAPGPMIVDEGGNLVWFHPLPAGEVAADFQVQRYQGRPALTWWQGRILALGFGQGEDVIYDRTYHRLATIRAGNGYHADLHEIRLTASGTAWIDAFDPIAMDLSAAHGSSRGVLTDSVIQQVDIKTGLVMWEWHALGHVPLSDSNNPVTHSTYPWDYVHVNSVSPGAAGDVLLSARNTWTLYDVNLHSGAFQWLAGDGRHSTVRLGPGVRFYWQHDAEYQPGGLISVFDNASSPPKEAQSRGLLLRLDLGTHRVTLVRQFTNPTKTLLAGAQANMSGLPHGDWLLGYGELPNFTEFDASGHVLLDATLGRNVQDFRSYLSPWSARPTSVPAVAAQRAGAGVTVEASWNGATNVASWQLLAGSPTSLVPVLTAPRRGFETTLRARVVGPDVAVRALDAAGRTLAASAPVAPSPAAG